MANDQYPKYELKWWSDNYREKNFAKIKDRNRSLEFRLRFVNALVMEYHTHRYWIYSTDSLDNEYNYLYDKNPAQSLAVLLRAREYIDVILESMFKVQQIPDRDYSILAVSLLFEIYGELGNYNVHLDPKKKLRSLQAA